MYFYFLHILRGISLFILSLDRFNLYPICYHFSEKYYLFYQDVMHVAKLMSLEFWKIKKEEGRFWKISTEGYK